MGLAVSPYSSTRSRSGKEVQETFCQETEDAPGLPQSILPARLRAGGLKALTETMTVGFASLSPRSDWVPRPRRSITGKPRFAHAIRRLGGVQRGFAPLLFLHPQRGGGQRGLRPPGRVGLCLDPSATTKRGPPRTKVDSRLRGNCRCYIFWGRKCY